MENKKSDFRTVGEFEPQSSVLIGWPLVQYPKNNRQLNTDAVSVELVKHLCGQVRILIFCYNNDVINRSKHNLLEANIEINEIEFLVYPSEFMYPRDFGAEIMINDSGEKQLVNFDFNLYGLFSDMPIADKYKKFARFHAEHSGITKTVETKLISEGGDREFNGQGVMLTIEETEVNKRNPLWNKDDIEKEFKNIFNLQKIIWLPQAAFDDEHMFSGPIPDENNNFTAYRSASANGHIDEICRFVNENTILIAHITEEESQKSVLAKLNKDRLDKAYKVLTESANADGKYFNIIKIPVPEPIYLNIEPGDNIHKAFQTGYEVFNGKMIDGSIFPTGLMKVLPALSYCNFLICNNKVIAQKYYREGMKVEVKQKDAEALSVLKNIFPGKEVVTIDTIALNIYGGGIHCNTRNIPV